MIQHKGILIRLRKVISGIASLKSKKREMPVGLLPIEAIKKGRGKIKYLMLSGKTLLAGEPFEIFSNRAFLSRKFSVDVYLSLILLKYVFKNILIQTIILFRTINSD